MKWERGRQEKVVYFKKLLFLFSFWGFNFDCYLIKYLPNTRLPRHKDIVEGGKHWRFNITLKGKSTFYIVRKGFLKRFYSFCLFRPDIEEHWVETKEDCLKLSIGFAYVTR